MQMILIIVIYINCFEATFEYRLDGLVWVDVTVWNLTQYCSAFGCVARGVRMGRLRSREHAH